MLLTRVAKDKSLPFESFIPNQKTIKTSCPCAFK
ncbi:hypothetical protein [Legionella sp.]